jgi:hypothetical protein
MNRGFTIELINNNKSDRDINLFTNEGLPDDVTVNVINTKNNYDFLLNIAIGEGFFGSGLMINSDLVNCITIHDGSKFEIVSFENMLIEKKILINGTSNFISLTVPPSSHLVLALLPILD